MAIIRLVRWHRIAVSWRSQVPTLQPADWDRERVQVLEEVGDVVQVLVGMQKFQELLWWLLTLQGEVESHAHGSCDSETLKELVVKE